MSAPRLRTVTAFAALLVALGCVAVVATWLLTGGRWFVVETPSMG
ncbi:MAG: S26 family signal peptidase, partial [Jatrophihabitans endophyticus]|nr:S26 family signal peptidase [Jatrophihabitans endophyticus]